MDLTDFEKYQVSPVTHRLVVKSRIGYPARFMEMPIKWVRAVFSPFGFLKSGRSAGLTDLGIPLGLKK
ncbi:MAG TPA: hypothetical protein QGH84_09085, partial [Rhodospirillales bacterium]|nr:hypothetical protein [Rhodospirillales bacterium]